MSVADRRPRLLLVGGSGGLVGRATLPALADEWSIRSVHRNPVPAETAAGVEWVPVDLLGPVDWDPLLADVDCVLTLAWYRWASRRTFERLGAQLRRLIEASRRRGVHRFLHVSVPSAPETMEGHLPYLVEKRRVDAALTESGLSYRILRPTLLFGRGDVLLGVMLRLIDRYGRFPMFEDGRYHVSPFATADLAEALCLEAKGREVGTIDLGGPRRFEYRELTDHLFRALGRPPRYFRWGRRTSLFVAGAMVRFGSTLLYPYEVEWLLSDRLGVAPYAGLGRPLTPVEPYLAAEAARLRAEGGRQSAYSRNSSA
jgi:uncharacterized protein YbjT (DUF2867 family)